MININEKTMWTIQELADYTGYKISYLRKLCSKDKIKYHIPAGGRRVFFCKDEIIEWMKGYTTKTRHEIINKAKNRKDGHNEKK